MQLFCANSRIFFKFFQTFFGHENMKKTALKSCSYSQVSIKRAARLTTLYVVKRAARLIET